MKAKKFKSYEAVRMATVEMPDKGGKMSTKKVPVTFSIRYNAAIPSNHKMLF